MTYDNIAAWLVWVIPLIACLFVPVIAKKGDKVRNYFVIAIAVVVACFGVFIGAWCLFRQWTRLKLHQSVKLDSRSQRRSIH